MGVLGFLFWVDSRHFKASFCFVGNVFLFLSWFYLQSLQLFPIFVRSFQSCLDLSYAFILLFQKKIKLCWFPWIINWFFFYPSHVVLGFLYWKTVYSWFSYFKNEFLSILSQIWNFDRLKGFIISLSLIFHCCKF